MDQCNNLVKDIINQPPIDLNNVYDRVERYINLADSLGALRQSPSLRNLTDTMTAKITDEMLEGMIREMTKWVIREIGIPTQETDVIIAIIEEDLRVKTEPISIKIEQKTHSLHSRLNE